MTASLFAWRKEKKEKKKIMKKKSNLAGQTSFRIKAHLPTQYLSSINSVPIQYSIPSNGPDLIRHFITVNKKRAGRILLFSAACFVRTTGLIYKYVLYPRQ